MTSETTTDYLRYADEAMRSAALARTDEERQSFIDMARTWAEAAAKIEGRPFPLLNVIAAAPRGFSDTAAYFDGRAATTRNEERRTHFRETADFYRSLAKITPRFPKGYAAPKTFHANRWRARAEECRTMAETFSNAQSREQMLMLADSYDAMAAREAE